MREDPHKSLADRYRQSLAPAPPVIDQHALWFEAGRASVRSRQSHWWLSAYSGVMTATAAGLALVVLADRPETEIQPAMPQIVSTIPPPPRQEASSPERRIESAVVEVDIEAQPEVPGIWLALFPARSIDPDSYLARRERALRGDLGPSYDDSVVSWSDQAADGFDETDLEPTPPATRRRLLEEYLPEAVRPAASRMTTPRPAADPRTESPLSNAKELA